MCSATPAGDQATADLTAQARIRNAAIAHFARDGYQQTSVRTIAAAAGVSAGLVIHHFGSKENLRSVCDEYVLDVLVGRARAEAKPAGMQDVLREYLANPEEYRLQVRYLTRAIEDDSPTARRFVDTMVDEAEAILGAGAADGSMRPSSDPRAQAFLTVLISLATLTMPPPLAKALGYPEFGPDVLRRLATPTLELFTYGLYTDDTALRTAEQEWQK